MAGASEERKRNRKMAETCACGCGGVTRSKWVPGHDSTALATRIKRQWGSTEEFVRWFDETYPTAVVEVDR